MFNNSPVAIGMHSCIDSVSSERNRDRISEKEGEWREGEGGEEMTRGTQCVCTGT